MPLDLTDLFRMNLKQPKSEKQEKNKYLTDLIRMNLNHVVLHLGVIAESNNGQIWIDRQIISDELLCCFVNPLPPTMSIHFRWSLYDQDILKKKWKKMSKVARYCGKWPNRYCQKKFKNAYLHFSWSINIIKTYSVL